MNNNTVSLSWGPAPADGMNGELIAYAVIIKASNALLFVGPCYSSITLQNLDFTADTCIQMAAATKAGFGKLTDCIKLDLGELIVTIKKFVCSNLKLS